MQTANSPDSSSSGPASDNPKPLAHYRSLSVDDGLDFGGALAATEKKMMGSGGGGGPRHRHSNSMDGSFDTSSFESDSLSVKKAMAPDRLAELSLIDPKRAKRILANRQSAAHSKERKTRYTSDLERKVQALQTEATTLSVQITVLQTSGLTAENKEQKFRLQALEQQAHLRDALNETLREELQRLKIEAGQIPAANGNRGMRPHLLPHPQPFVQCVDNLHTNVRYNQPHNNPKRKRSRFLKIGGNSLKITSPTSSTTGVSKPKITKKPPDSSAPQITRPCTECGKKFWSWKALFGHMRCHPERQWRGINPPPNIRPRHNNVDSPSTSSEFSPRKKHKSVSHVIMTDEDYEIAESLLLLANGSKPDDIINNAERDDNVVKDRNIVDIVASEPCSSSGRFECSGCKKVFGSHQALGGHRASHKNVKGCFASASVSGSGVTQAVITNFDLNFPPPVTLISGEDQYDSSSSYSSTYSGSALDLRLKL
ncbi:hypothetical protein K7X08_006075 [Anisodus acutangulus]|uniref:Uncharacterized protein n=1 Tax=Anisodus acutangulus TaxID=402998 RepID=A0A9Q1LS56_9SOLA|nr:hypothetical protein K7X08_006075 [Anisodus acutangulus]